MSSKSKRNRNGGNKPSGLRGIDRSGLLTPLSRQALAINLALIVDNSEQFTGPALVKLASTVTPLAGKSVSTLPDTSVLDLWDRVYDVIAENAQTYDRLMPPGSHDDCALDLQLGLNAVGLPDEMAWEEPILDRGGVIIMPCPACSEGSEPHTLKIHKVGGEFVVEADA